MGLNDEELIESIKQHQACYLRKDKNGLKKSAEVIFKKCGPQVLEWIVSFTYRYGISQMLNVKGDTTGVIEINDIINEVWQEIFDQLRKKSETGVPIINFQEWLRSLVRNIVFEKANEIWEIRRRQQLVPEDGNDENMETEHIIDEEFNEILEQDEINYIMQIARNCLTDKEFEVVESYYSHGIPTSEIAQRLGISQDAVQARLRKARQKIKSSLQREERFFYA